MSFGYAGRTLRASPLAGVAAPCDLCAKPETGSRKIAEEREARQEGLERITQ